MDRRPTLETRPPVLIDAVVRTLIPSACREHVVGDLWERYKSPGSFAIDAIRTLPFIVASQIRRTSTIGALVIQGFLLFVGFAVGAGTLVSPTVPVVAALVGLVLRDAYKRCVSLSARQVIRDLAVAAGFVVASQVAVAIVRPSLLLPMPALIGGAAAIGMLFFLRLQNPGLGAQPRRLAIQPPASLDALIAEVRLYQRMGLRAVRIEVGAGVVIAGFFLFPLSTAQNWVLRVGWALAAAYGLYVAVVVSRHRPRPMPDGLGFNDSVVFYRSVLERQHAMVSTMWRWYVLPFAPAIVFIMVGGAMVAAGRGRPMWPAAVLMLIAAGIGFIIHAGSQDMARKLRARIDALRIAEEQ